MHALREGVHFSIIAILKMVDKITVIEYTIYAIYDYM